MSTTRLRLHVGIVGREVENEKWEDAGKRGKGREWLLGRKRWHVAATAVPVHFLQPDSAQGTETSYVIHFLSFPCLSLLAGKVQQSDQQRAFIRVPKLPQLRPFSYTSRLGVGYMVGGSQTRISTST